MRYARLSAVVALVLAGLVGCVDLPESGFTPPDYQAEVRIVYADANFPPAITLSVAPGPAFTQFTDLPSGARLEATPYTSYDAGGKRIFVKDPQDPDTLVVTFGTETRGTLYVFPRLAPVPPSVIPVGTRFRYVAERYIYSSLGLPDTTAVRFVNAITSGDTIDISTGSTVVADNLALSRVSATYTFPASETRTFYLTLNTQTTPKRDSITIAGASRKAYTVLAYDSLAAGKLKAFEEQ